MNQWFRTQSTLSKEQQLGQEIHVLPKIFRISTTKLLIFDQFNDKRWKWEGLGLRRDRESEKGMRYSFLVGEGKVRWSGRWGWNLTALSTLCFSPFWASLIMQHYHLEDSSGQLIPLVFEHFISFINKWEKLIPEEDSNDPTSFPELISKEGTF